MSSAIQGGKNNTTRENFAQDNYSLLENESSVEASHGAGNRTPLTKKAIRSLVIVALILVMFCPLIYWMNRARELDNTGTEIEKTGAEELNSNLCNEHTHGSRPRNNCNITEKERLLKYLRFVSDSNLTISGIYTRNPNEDSQIGIEKVRRIAGVFPGLLSISMPIYSATAEKWDFFVDSVIFHWNNSYLVSIDWHEQENPLTIIRNYTDKSDSATVERNWKSLTEDGGHLNKVWKNQLDLIVPYFQRLQTAGVVPIIDILPVINDKGYSWRGRPGVNGTMKLYKITYDYLTKTQNLNSLIWTWSLDKLYMNQFEEFWPGSEYVDVASIYMGQTKELPITHYHRLLDIMGDKPIMSLENLWTVPTPQQLAAQPRWTWFTASSVALDMHYNNDAMIRTTLNSTSVINRGNIAFFLIPIKVI